LEPIAKTTILLAVSNAGMIETNRLAPDLKNSFGQSNANVFGTDVGKLWALTVTDLERSSYFCSE
jgi:hypothetical protein